MDPEATLKLLAEAVGTAHWEEAKEHAENLLNWFSRSGFPPNITGVKIFDSMMLQAVCEKIVRW